MKRLFDVCIAGLVLVLLSPVILFVSLAIFLSMGRPMLFVQDRVGKHERIFSLYKFRTMALSTSDFVSQKDDEQRLTRVGRVVRAFSLDELPQLFNVIKGDMSLVGPRPLLVRYLPRYSQFQRRRHEVLPGITGWAQVNGRNAVSWDTRFQQDVWYVDNMSLWLDIKILFLTVLKVLKRSDVSSGEYTTMTEFMGSGS